MSCSFTNDCLHLTRAVGIWIVGLTQDHPKTELHVEVSGIEMQILRKAFLVHPIQTRQLRLVLL